MTRPRAARALALTALVAALGTTVALASCGNDHHPPGHARHGQPAAPSDGKPELRELVLDGPPGEQNDGTLFGAPEPLLRSVVERIDAVRTDVHAKGLFLRVGPFGGAFARQADLHRALARLRAAHKPVHCHFDVADNASYLLLASSCDRISMTPAGELELVGVAAHLFYAKRLLDNVGVRADLLQMGRFKGASEPFTREAASPELRESMGGMLDDLEGSLVAGVAEGRHLDAPAVQALIDGGPYDSAGALSAHLIDAVAFDDEARQQAKLAAHAERVTRVSLGDDQEPFDVDAFLSALAGEEVREIEPHAPRLALVVLTGEITDGEGGRGSGASDPFIRELRRLGDDADVKAVVLRIDSPGGSALASDRMWHAVRRVAGRKPVVVSVGEMAASGGYYIACAGTEIVAEDTSIVGSIGVVGGKVVVADLAQRIGITGEVMGRGAHSGYTSPLAPFTDEERALVGRQMHSTYERFLGRVALGRHLDVPHVTAAAEGRIWSGKAGRAHGLVDREGGLADALDRARTLGHLGATAPVTSWPAPRSPVQRLAQLLGAGSGEETESAVPGLALGASRDLASHLAPGLVALVGRMGVLLPLLSGREHTVVAMPVVVELE